MQNRKEIICLTGFMGCGKSSVGKELSRRLGCPFTDLDDYIVKREGRSIPEIFKEGEPVFRSMELSALEDFLAEHQGPAVLALGGGTFSVENARCLALSRTRTVYLRTELSEIMRRLGPEDSSRPLFADAQALYESRLAHYEQAEYIVDTDGLSPDKIAEAIIDRLSA